MVVGWAVDEPFGARRCSAERYTSERGGCHENQTSFDGGEDLWGPARSCSSFWPSRRAGAAETKSAPMDVAQCP